MLSRAVLVAALVALPIWAGFGWSGLQVWAPDLWLVLLVLIALLTARLPSDSPDWHGRILRGRPPPWSKARRPGERPSHSSRDGAVGPVDANNDP